MKAASLTLVKGNPEVKCPDQPSVFSLKRLGSSMALCTLLGLTSCATIVSGPTQKIKITSTPVEANVTVKKLTVDQESVFWEGKTPAEVKFNRKESYLVKISNKGYKSVEVPVEYKSMNGWIWGNLFIGGLVGIIVDGVSGAGITLGPDPISVDLVK